MEPFVFLFVYLLCVWLISAHITDENKRIRHQCVLSFLGLLFYLGFHSPTLGIDIENAYVPAFEMSSTDFIHPESIFAFEKGFVVYMSLVKCVTSSPQVYLFISAFIILLPIFYLIYEKSKIKMLSIIIYASWQLYVFSFSGLRQAIAVSIVCLGYKFIYEKKLIYFLGLVVLATFIHTSALLSVVAYPLFWSNINKKLLLISGTIFIIALVSSHQILELAANIVFRGEAYSSKLSNVEYGGIGLAFVYVAWVVFDLIVDKSVTNRYLPFFILLTAIQFTGMYSNNISRIGYYFIPFMIIGIPNAIHTQNNIINRRFMIFGVVSVVIFFFFYSIRGGIYGIIPFSFFWQ